MYVLGSMQRRKKIAVGQCGISLVCIKVRIENLESLSFSLERRRKSGLHESNIFISRLDIGFPTCQLAMDIRIVENYSFIILQKSLESYFMQIILMNSLT